MSPHRVKILVKLLDDGYRELSVVDTATGKTAGPPFRSGLRDLEQTIKNLKRQLESGGSTVEVKFL